MYNPCPLCQCHVEADTIRKPVKCPWTFQCRNLQQYHKLDRLRPSVGTFGATLHTDPLWSCIAKAAARNCVELGLYRGHPASPLAEQRICIHMYDSTEDQPFGPHHGEVSWVCWLVLQCAGVDRVTLRVTGDTMQIQRVEHPGEAPIWKTSESRGFNASNRGEVNYALMFLDTFLSPEKELPGEGREVAPKVMPTLKQW